MAGLSQRRAENILNYVVGKTATPTLPTTYLALFTAVGTDSGTGATTVYDVGHSTFSISTMTSDAYIWAWRVN